MRYTPFLLAALTLTACQTGAVPTPEPEFDPSVGPGIDTSLTAGYTQEDHTEVAPGVFLLTSLYETGEYTYVPGVAPLESTDGEFVPPDAITPTSGPAGPGGGSSSYCYEYDYEYYSDSTSNASLFGGDTSWYGYATAYSYDYSYPTGYSYDVNSVSTYVYTYAPDWIDYVYAYGYVYVNDNYIGYVSDYVTSGRSAYAYGSWEMPCLDGYLDVRVTTSHYAYDYPSGDYTIRQSLSIGNTVEAYVTCCP